MFNVYVWLRILLNLKCITALKTIFTNKHLSLDVKLFFFAVKLFCPSSDGHFSPLKESVFSLTHWFINVIKVRCTKMVQWVFNMETADLPDNTLILDSLIHSVLVINKEFIICYANHSALQVLHKAVENYLKHLSLPFQLLLFWCWFNAWNISEWTKLYRQWSDIGCQQPIT